MAQESEVQRPTTVDANGDSIVIRRGSGNVKIKFYEEIPNGSCTPLFEKGKGPQAYPYSIGVFCNL